MYPYCKVFPKKTLIDSRKAGYDVALSYILAAGFLSWSQALAAGQSSPKSARPGRPTATPG